MLPIKTTTRVSRWPSAAWHEPAAAGEHPGGTDADRAMIAPAAGCAAPPCAAVVLTCASRHCRHSFEPDEEDLAAAQLACPRCGGWTFQAALIQLAGGASS